MKNDADDIKLYFDNDASASSFGWNFQTNAGIFLFLHYIHDATQIKIESKYEDIEIKLKDDSMIFAQAKSVQYDCLPGNAKKKLKDAFVSLAKVPVTDRDRLIYISNLSAPIKNGEHFFDNSIIPYSECLEGMKQTIQGTLSEITNYLEKRKTKECNSNKINKYEAFIQKIKNLNLNQIEICSIYPFYGEEKNRYRPIKDSVLDTLTTYFQLNRDDAVCIGQKLMEHWQSTFEFNSTIKDGSLKKIISKETFLWPVVVFLADNVTYDINDSMTFVADSSLMQEANEYMSSSIFVYHERFQFVNEVLRDYAKFKKSYTTENGKQIEKKYIMQEYKKFLAEFMEIKDAETREYVLKASLYRIILNNKRIQKISKEAIL